MNNKLEPQTGYDFDLQLNGESIGKFMECNFQIQLDAINITLSRGIIDTTRMAAALGVDLSYNKEGHRYEGLRSPVFELTFQAIDPARIYTLGGFRIDTLQVGCMPGKRMPVIEMKGVATKFDFTEVKNND